MSCRNPSKTARDFWLRLAIYIFYALLGAGIFMAVENHPYEEYEENFKQNEVIVENQLTALRNVTNVVVSSMTNKEMLKLAEKITEINKLVSKPPDEWTFYQGYRLSFEIMSTIGYGSTPPKTQAGRLIAVFYTIFGIPIFLFLIKSIGEVINKQITKFIRYVEKKLLKREVPKNVELKVLVGFTCLLLADVLLEAGFFSIQRDMTFIDGLYCVIISATTVGFGDITLNNELTMIISLCLLSTVLDGVSCYAAKKFEEGRALASKQGCCKCFGRKKKKNSPEEEMEAYGAENKAIDHERMENIETNQA